ncbi:hypothetical protein VOLCADRAFT_127356 [Volvox carteri f. nagariensis]|uniref:RNA-editing substrate-binding complex 6 protein domain-containing protein n=1 Tax=Volvox carteri f. nagariensis TaxID=3068 RepID=D8THR3_VOLCA|nr:uncharacterized protein VOLCADRAFT_127356 [Volvox carteri f. nagariensis]EFJ52759.1 hypothetical protein VOLCADRAFT_127356 [Volvox carteri f. nagariensis]|eukprot:XP_002945764.1 hypothetical protein VOLCADRAFT_127356 [Volvox carteri f. nagariensis]
MPAVAAGGGVVGTLRIIQRTAGGVGARTAAATDRDADLLSRIAELRNLRDAELLVYDAGSWFRSKHAAKLLARLPELDLQTSNSGPRTRRMIRFLSAATLRDLSPLPGPDLARCLAAFARLTYVPPEIVAPICAALTAAGSRKLRACSGTELAELAWGLASLEQLYGDMHQAVRQPARAVAQLASGGGGGGARVVGYVRGGGDSGVLGVRVGSGEQVGPQLVQKLTAAAEEEDGTAEVAAAATEGTTKAEGPQPAAAEAVEETKTTLHRSGDGVDRARASSSSSSSGGDGADSKVVQAAATSCADHALASSLPSALEEKEEEEVAAAAVARTTNDGSSSGGGGGGGGGGGRLLSTTRGRQHRHHDRAHAAPVMVWLVPRAMDRIWERLAAAAGLCAERGGMQGEQLAKVSWAYARVGRTDQRLYDKLSAAALVLMEPFQKRIQAAAAEAVSEPRYGVGGSRRSSSSAAAAAVARSGVAPPLDPTSVTTLAWAFVAAGRRDPPLLAALATVAASYKGVFENDQVVTLARSYAQARHYDEALCTAFAMVASRRHRHLTGRQLTALIGALAALGHRDDELGGPRLARMVWDKKGDLSAEEVCELMWACAQLGLDEQRGPAGLGFGVLGLGPADGAARPTSPSSSRSLTSSLSPRSKLAAAANAAAGSIGGRGGGGGAAATSATLALATALRGRCEGLTPVDLARALWASSLLLLPLLHEPGYSHHAVQQLLWDLVSEVRQQLVRHPPESFSQDALLQLYGAAQLLGPAVPPSVTGRDMGSVELAGGYQSGVEEEGKGEGKAAPADRLIGLQDERDGEAADVVQRDRGRLYGRAAAGSGSAAAVRMYGTEAITQSGLQAQADQRQHDPQAQQEKHEQPEKEQQHRHRQHRPRATWGRRVSGFTEFGPNPYDGSWSDVDWGRIRVAADAAVPQLTPTQAGADPRVTHGRGATSPKRRMKYSFDSANETTAAALPSSEYDVRKMYDEASGRELWEVVPKARAGGAGAGDVEGPLAARVLPAALLRACQAAAAEWAAAERLRLEAVEAQEAELWRLDVAAALRDLTAAEPLLRWVAPDNTAVADFLVLQPPPPLPAQSRTSGAAAYGVTAPAPLAVLLVGDTECTRNPPFMPLGWARMRQRLLEASGARVLVVPYFLWGMPRHCKSSEVPSIGQNNCTNEQLAYFIEK